MGTALVTGGSSGIGADLARQFHAAGHQVILVARRRDRLENLATELGAGTRVLVADLADPGAPARIFAATGPVDVLVNNAGLGWVGRLDEMPDEKVDELIATNLKGMIATTQAALPAMLARRRGVIINVASVVGFRAAPYSAVYSATKHAVVGLSHALRGELSGTGVKVCVVYPAGTQTDFFKTAAAIGPQYPAWWVANAIVRTARFPRRDVIVLPYRLAHISEPFIGGLLDHTLGEARRKASPTLAVDRPAPSEDA